MRSARLVLLDSASANSSTFTSNAFMVADYDILSVHWPDGGNSRLTLQGSDDDGLRSSINSYSDMTGIITAGIYTVDPGVRWIRALRSSADSLAAVTIQAKRNR